MTAYVHFLDRTQPPVKLHNVEAVTDDGPDSVAIRNTYGGERRVFTGVRNVAIEPDRE